MSRDFRISAALFGSLAGGVVMAGATVALVLVFRPPLGAGLEGLYSTPEFFRGSLVASGVAGLVGGFAAARRAQGLEIRHALALVLFWLLLSQLSVLRHGVETTQVTYDFVQIARVVSGIGVLVGALPAKGLRFLQVLRLRRRGVEVCRNCQFQVDAPLTTCPRCGCQVAFRVASSPA